MNEFILSSFIRRKFHANKNKRKKKTNIILILKTTRKSQKF